MIRIGHGYDVHKLVDGEKLVLGGVNIKYPKGLLGHSDADVLIHAIMDSLLGASALGDIGKLFPDCDNKYKNIDSTILLNEVYLKISQHGYKINNIDCTVIAQAPKLSPYIDDMVKNISTILQISKQQINIKATTEEHLGFTGSGDGISAHSVCIINND